MRKIKFRLWDSYAKLFIYQGCHIDFDGNIFAGDLTVNLTKESPRFILTQFTGLYDKNGKEIYEGDWVRYFKDLIFDVRYKDGMFGLYDENLLFHPLNGHYASVSEVIGNVHKNTFKECKEII